jgi:hypothetical protein
MPCRRAQPNSTARGTTPWAVVERIEVSSAPAVMVSSTLYDLRHIRADLARFIADELGYIPLLSELPSFPVNPDLDTVANCRRTR